MGDPPSVTDSIPAHPGWCSPPSGDLGEPQRPQRAQTTRQQWNMVEERQGRSLSGYAAKFIVEDLRRGRGDDAPAGARPYHRLHPVLRSGSAPFPPDRHRRQAKAEEEGGGALTRSPSAASESATPMKTASVQAGIMPSGRRIYNLRICPQEKLIYISSPSACSFTPGVCGSHAHHESEPPELRLRRFRVGSPPPTRFMISL